jgi:TolB-like protein/DNA-binding SARP family transcriptional activator
VAALHISLLGGFEARLASGEALPLKGRKTQALLAYLAVGPGEPRSREELVALFWGDRGEEQARSSLRQSLSELRKALGEADHSPLIAGRDAVSLDTEAVDVDVTEFERLIDDGTPTALEEAAELYRGDLLDGIGVHDPAFEDWLRGERQRLSERACEALSRLLDHQVAGDSETAIATGRRLLAIDPLREATHRALMRLYAGKGERALALKQYQACCDVLAAELGVAPDPETEALAEEIRGGAAATGKTVDPVLEPKPPSDRPSIAVLPFTNLSGDPEQDYFAQGITQDIITELARFSSLRVVAQLSAFELGDRARDPKSAGQILGVRRLVTGNLRKASNRVRVSVQLIDCETGAHVWAERYDRELEDIFAIQDEVVHAIVVTLGGRIAAAETERALRKRPDKLEAYDCVLRCDHYLDLYDRESLEEGYRLAEQAIAAAPSYARAYGSFAWFNGARSWFEPDNAVHLDRAREFASEAVKLDPSDGQCWQHLATIHLYRREFDEAERCNRQAQACNPNDVIVVARGAEVLAYLGHWQEALEVLRQFQALEPLAPNWHWEVIGLSHFALGRYAEACEAMTRMSALNYWNHARLAACYSHLGQDEKAQEHLKAYAAEAPDPTIRGYAQSENYFKNPEDLEPWLVGLRKAGLPE